MLETSFLADPVTLSLGAVTGLVFGFLLQKGGVTRADTIVGQLLLRDFTMLKVMLTAIVVGGLGVYGMLALGWLEGLHVKSAVLLANAVGGVIFGAGMALLGYCPGTGVAALGDGARDAVAGVLGMLVGAGLYAEAEPWLARVLGGTGELGKATFVTETGVAAWWWLLGLAGLGAALFVALERRGRRGRPTTQPTARPGRGAHATP